MISKSVIEKYTSCFHDGSLIAIEHKGKKIDLSMISAEIDPENIQDAIPLSSIYGMTTISGILHLEDVKHVFVDDNELHTSLKMQADSGDIYSFEIIENKILLHILWDNYRPKQALGCSTIKIEASSIIWESIPDLKDPFW